jgi:crossover junction endodeoxyribonuclease RuvC
VLAHPVTANVLGLDLGLAHAGAATYHLDGRIGTWRYDTGPLPDHAPITQVAARIRSVARWAVGRATTGTVLVVVEGPAHAATYGQPHERAGVWWRTVDALCRAEVPVAVLPPTTVKKYLTGKGNAPKALMRSTVAALFPARGLDRISADEADGVALATCGADWLGWPGPYLEGRRGAGWLRTSAQWPDRATIRTETTP